MTGDVCGWCGEPAGECECLIGCLTCGQRVFDCRCGQCRKSVYRDRQHKGYRNRER